MSVEEQISQLIDKYEGLDTRRLKQFNEENTKKDFILPLFRHLGWDVTNSDEVAAEEKSSNGRVDYAFKIGGVSKFYLEAKPLREDLNQRPDWAKQVITYAENKGVTWAVLTNFKQLVVFNAEWDEPALERARFLNLTYQEYLPAFHKLWWLSRDSVEKGVLDEEARQVGALKPKLPVEKSLLDQLLRWREELFNQIYQHNKDRGLDFLQIDELIQQFINRLIFIRSTEDRGIEENKLRAALHQWRDSGHKGELVERMRAIFHEFATLYDSDLFPLLDTWNSLFVESDTIEKIIEGSYERPTRLAGYDFAAIDPKVWGAVYEQYLGYVAQEAKEEAKKKVAQARLLGFEAPAFELEARRIKRKQQGIYYTPEFVVDYIVKETVGRFIEEHSYNDIFNIKILDPACGSGSFLIRAYDELLHYHARQQGKSPAELDHLERRTILLRNIFGVDLDRQAVEITRLSLLLRSLAQREILPSLADNIREGNSLISGTEEELKKYFGDNWRDKKPFNWEEEFRDIMANGGFDVVIGNPPYGAELNENEKTYLDKKYSQFKSQVKNSAIYFIYKAGELLNSKGAHSYIVPKSLCYSLGWNKCAGFVMSGLQKLIDTGKAFEKVKLEQVIFVKVVGDESSSYINGLYDGYEVREFAEVGKNVFAEHNVLLTGQTIEEMKIIKKIIGRFNGRWADYVSIERGLNWQSQVGKKHGSSPIHRGAQLSPYFLDKATDFIDLKKFSKNEYQYQLRPKVLNQLAIAHVQNPYPHFYLQAALDLENRLVFETISCTFVKDDSVNIKFLLAINNSKLFAWLLYKFVYSNAIRSTRYDEQYIGKVPCPSFGEINQKLITQTVEQILAITKDEGYLSNLTKQAKVKELERQIDQKVYELYGLTEEEIQIIEASLVSKS